mmetsp:Transcript_42959/g.68982  ORF Transcript_42959/g.68982 Transcript_42959/m.68982 type:complete len:606 (+) Transcript_42959:173-1990(+)
MGDALSKLFVPLNNLPGLYKLPDECIYSDEHPFQENANLGGICQLGFLAFVYAYVLFQASNMIADGSELLLLIPEMAPIVGSVVIPILGAVPDGAVVLFSGLGERSKAQEQLSVGVGALAGSTIMLLTVPWTLSVLAGRVSIVRGRCTYKRPANAGEDWKKLSDKHARDWSKSGVGPAQSAMRAGARTMAITCASYIIIQGAAFAYSDPDPVKVGIHEKYFALVGLILCFVLFMWYLYEQVSNSNSDQVLQDIVDEKREAALKSGILSLQGAFFNALHEYDSSADTHLLENEHRYQRFESIVKKFFNQYDVNNDNSIDRHELKLLLTDLHIAHTPENLDNFMKEMDADGSGDIHFNEFLECMLRLVSNSKTDGEPVNRRGNYGSTNTTSGQIRELLQHHERSSEEVINRIQEEQHALNESQHEGEEEEEEEDVPEDLADLPPDAQRRHILFRAFRLMGTGTVLVLLFSDPMVDVMSEIGKVLHISSFYISFILAPLASNASEFIASYSYALKKTSKTITISLTALEGAAIMNNTFCLGIFLALVYFRGLAWEFSAETIAILFVEACMVLVARQPIQTMRMSVFVFSLFPISLLIVFVLENVFGLN